MSDRDYAAALRELCSDYYANRISFAEYREQRKVVLQELDDEFNGWHATEAPVVEQDPALMQKTAEVVKFRVADSQNGKSD